MSMRTTDCFNMRDIDCWHAQTNRLELAFSLRTAFRIKINDWQIDKWKYRKKSRILSVIFIR